MDDQKEFEVTLESFFDDRKMREIKLIILFYSFALLTVWLCLSGLHFLLGPTEWQTPLSFILGRTAVGVAIISLLLGAMVAFQWIVPYHLFEEIKNGNWCVTIITSVFMALVTTLILRVGP